MNYPPSPCSSSGTPDSESSSNDSQLQPALKLLPQKKAKAKFKLTPVNPRPKNNNNNDQENSGYFDDKELLSLAREADDDYKEAEPQPDAVNNNQKADYQDQGKRKDQDQEAEYQEEEYNMYESKNKNTHHNSNWDYKNYSQKKDEYDPNGHNKPATPSGSPVSHRDNYNKRNNYQNYAKKNYNDSYQHDYPSLSNNRSIANKSYKNNPRTQSKSRHERYIKNNEQANRYDHQSKTHNQDYRYNDTSNDIGRYKDRSNHSNVRYNDRSAESYNDPSRYYAQNTENAQNQVQSNRYNYSRYPQQPQVPQRKSAVSAPRVRRNYDNKNQNYYRDQRVVRTQKTWICSLCWATNNGNDTFCSKCNTMIPHNDQYLPPKKRREMFAESVQMAANVVLRAAQQQQQQQQQQPYAQPYAPTYAPTFASAYTALPLPLPQAQKQRVQNIQQDEKQEIQLKSSSNQERKTVEPTKNKYSAKLAAQRAEEKESKSEHSKDKDKDSEIMLKLIDKLEKRQSKIDINENKVDGALATLQLQQKEMFEKLQSDRTKMEAEFKSIEKTMKQQFKAQKMALISVKNYLNDTTKTFEAFHERTAKTLFVATSETDKNRLQKKLVTKMRDFDKKSADFQCIQQPSLYYESHLSQRYAKFQEFQEYDEKQDVMGNKIKIVFADGVLCGVVPVPPASVDVSLSRSYQLKPKEENNINIADNGSDTSEASQLSQISAVTSAKFNVFNNVRVMFDYDDIGKFQNRTLNILAHQIVVELKNHKAFSIIIDDSTIRHYEYKEYPNLKIYEGVVKVRSKNKNGWCSYKIIPFKFDEFGNKLQMDVAESKDNK